jgi:hypothetical protein
VHIEECNDAFAVECISDKESRDAPSLLSMSDSSMSEASSLFESVPHDTSFTSLDVLSGTHLSMLELVPISDSSVAGDPLDDTGPDGMPYDMVDPVEDVLKLKEDVDWSAVRTFQDFSLGGEAAVLDDAKEDQPCPRIELIDSGCTCHISPYKDSFTTLRNISPRAFRAANKQHFSATAQGNMAVEVPNGISASTLKLHEVLYSPEVGYTLIEPLLCIFSLLKGSAESDHFTFLRGPADLGPDISFS